MKITPLMTSLHEGHKAEERLKCIDNMLTICEDTKHTILQAFWWYRKNSIPLDKVKEARVKIGCLEVQIQRYHNDDPMVSQAEVLKILDDLVESEKKE